MRKYMYACLLLLLIPLLSAFDKSARPPVLTYVAAMSIPQAGDPIVNELENTTGSKITVTRYATGRYRIESDPPVFVVGRTYYSTQYYNMGPSITVLATMRCIQQANCEIWIVSSDPFGNSQYFYDGGTNGQFIPVRIDIYQ